MLISSLTGTITPNETKSDSTHVRSVEHELLCTAKNNNNIDVRK